MAKSLGNGVRLYVESTTTGTFNQVKGQTTLSRTRQGQQIDSTTKDDGAYGTSFSGSKSLSIQAGFLLDLPDANGMERLFTLATADPAVPFNIQLRNGALADPADVIFKGSVTVLNLDDGADMNSMASVSMTFGAAAAPVIDMLG